MALAALLLPTALAESCPTCIMPTHSWDTLPVSFHSSEFVTNTKGEFTTDEMGTISRFPLVTIEKWQGVNAVSATGDPVFLWEEDAMVAAARQIKAARPGVSVVVWLDSTNIYSGWIFPPNLTSCEHCSAGPDGELINHTFNSDVYAVQGHSRAAEYLESNPDLLLKNSSGHSALGWGGLHVYDHRQARVRDLWRDNCLSLTRSGVIDGCGADFSTYQPKGLTPSAEAEWLEGHSTMLREATAALAPQGMLLAKDFGQVGDTVNGMLREGCTASNDTVTGFRKLAVLAKSSGQRYVAQCHFGHPQFVPPLNLTTAENVAAAFLCGAGPDHYFTTAGWYSKPKRQGLGNFTEHWLPSIMGRPLGEPKADAVYDAAAGEWTREFATGTAVAFNAMTGKGSIRWSDEK